MAKLSIETSKAQQVESCFQSIYNTLVNNKTRIDTVGENVRLVGFDYAETVAALQALAELLKSESTDADTLKSVLANAVRLYIQNEEGICQSGISGEHSENSAEDNEEWWEQVLDYIGDALKQATMGDFTDEGNFLGVILSVIIGLIPVVGPAADLRDFVADIRNLIDDGPTTEEWVALAFTSIGLIPLVGDLLKHGDDVADVTRNMLKYADNVDEIADTVKNMFRKGDEAFSAVADKIDDFNHAFSDRLNDIITNDELLTGIKNAGQELKDAVTNNPIVSNVNHALENMRIKWGKIDTNAKEIVKEVINNYKEDLEESCVTRLLDFILGNDKDAAAAPA